MTGDEAAAEIIEGARGLVRYWTSMVPEEMTMEQRVSGVAFSLLSMLDGDGPIDPCEVVMLQLDDDGNKVGEVRASGPLHELFYSN